MPPMSSSARLRNAPAAPGTVGMHCSTSYRRRSRLKPMTYSMCCHRPSSRCRFPTFVFPETAAHLMQPLREPEVGERLRLENRVRVDHDHNVVPCGGDAAIQSRRLARVRLTQDEDLGKLEPLHEVGGAVGRPVVDDDD